MAHRLLERLRRDVQTRHLLAYPGQERKLPADAATKNQDGGRRVLLQVTKAVDQLEKGELSKRRPDVVERNSGMSVGCTVVIVLGQHDDAIPAWERAPAGGAKQASA